jgi:hypothetical protein
MADTLLGRQVAESEAFVGRPFVGHDPPPLTRKRLNQASAQLVKATALRAFSLAGTSL